MAFERIRLQVGDRSFDYAPSTVVPIAERLVAEYTDDPYWLRELHSAVADAIDELPAITERNAGKDLSSTEVREFSLLLALHERLEQLLSWDVDLRVPTFMQERFFSTRKTLTLSGEAYERPGFNSYSFRALRAPSGRLKPWLVFHEETLPELLESFSQGAGQPSYIISGYPRHLFRPGRERQLSARLAHEYTHIHRALRRDGEKTPVYPVHELLLHKH